ncbi:MAG: heme lyase CcmF/NrfE family subunit [Desulfovibrionales bacterium]
MHIVAFASLVLAMLISLGMGIWMIVQLWKGEKISEGVTEKGQWGVFLLMLVGSAILLRAFVARDFSFLYVAEYSDSFLPMFYTVTAFWAGQAGSLLFWGLMISLFGALWTLSWRFKSIPNRTKGFYWLFFFSVQGFFLLLLTGPANPFVEIVPAPSDGSGLNPLLQHPGMIFHPPILFMGYAGFTIPALLAFASCFTGDSVSWLRQSRNWVILSWIFLTFGILLGAWWSYLELGWGGYWAWDPVENASLIPWLVSSAFLHTAVLGRQRKALLRTNVVLIGLTLTLCFFATYVVRSGVIDSLHAFGAKGIGVPLLMLILSTFALSLWAAFSVRGDNGTLGQPLSRQGLIVLLAMILSLLGLIVLLGTMWPVISSLWSDNPVGVDARFYNRTTLPFFVLITALLAVCPWLSWKEGVRHLKFFVIVLVVWVVALAGLWLLGDMTMILPLLGAGSAMAVLATVVLFTAADPGVRRVRRLWGVYGTHAGLALIVLGVAFSGPYKVEREFILEPGGTANISSYQLEYNTLKERSTSSLDAIRAEIDVFKNGERIGTLNPERRVYRNFNQPFAEVSVIPGLGDEVYATLLAATPESVISIKVSINPLVNWIWIGSVLMCLAAFFCLKGRRSTAPETTQG